MRSDTLDKINANPELKWAVERMINAAASEFYGTITLSFQKGKVVNLKREVNEKPPTT